MIKGIIFDLDGVLADSETKYLNQVVEGLKEQELEVNDELIKKMVGISDPVMVELLNNTYSGKVNGEKFIKDIELYNLDHPYDYHELMFDGVVETITHFKSRSYKLAVASSSPMYLIERALKEMGINRMFDSVLSGHDFKESKPNPEIYLKTLQAVDLKAEECVVIEDSYLGIKASKAASIITIAKNESKFGVDQSAADYVIEDFEEIIKIVEELNKGE